MPAEPSTNPERRVVDCWHDSASHWQQLLSHHRLASRAITNPAIEQAILSYQPGTLLDVGCGEGWLARQMAAQGIRVTATDAVATLVENARSQDPKSRYHCLEYAALPGPLNGQQYDLAVCNFSLFGDESVRQLLSTLPSMLSPGGKVLIQTLHPLSACQGDYREGWRNSQWQGLDSASHPPGEAPPWYFRPMASWLALLQQTGKVVEMEEPLDPDSRLPLSVIFHLQPDQQHEHNKR